MTTYSYNSKWKCAIKSTTAKLPCMVENIIMRLKQTFSCKTWGTNSFDTWLPLERFPDDELLGPRVWSFLRV